MSTNSLLAEARALLPETIALRRDIHRYPEIGNHLPRTRERVLDALDGLPLEIHLHETTSGIVGVLRGGLSGSNSHRSGSWRDSRRDLAAEAAKVSLKMREGTERPRARGATHIVVWRAGAQIIMENAIHFEHLQNE